MMESPLNYRVKTTKPTISKYGKSWLASVPFTDDRMGVMWVGHTFSEALSFVRMDRGVLADEAQTWAVAWN